MTPKLYLYFTLIVASTINCLYKDDLLGAGLSLAILPMVFIASREGK